jgi:hypothetical protein
VRIRHNPIVTQRPDGGRVVKCRDCRDATSSVPIGPGIPLSDQTTAWCVAENHRGHAVTVRQVAGPRTDTASETTSRRPRSVHLVDLCEGINVDRNCMTRSRTLRVLRPFWGRAVRYTGYVPQWGSTQEGPCGICVMTTN